MNTPRKWQRLAIEKISRIQGNGKDRALIAACPGAGKTYFTSCILANNETNKRAECFVIVVPSRALKKQWREALKIVGLRSIHDIDNATLEQRNKMNMDMFDPARPVNIVTYAQVASDADLFAALCARHRTFVVLDEVHHADDSAEFGKALVAAFDQAVFKLSLSGTPFNTAGGALAFCETKESIDDFGKRVRETVCDYTYSYGEALQATGLKDDPEVVRPVTFLQWEGNVWREYVDTKNQNTRVTMTFDGRKANSPLSPMLDPSLDYFKKMVREGLDRLTEIRLHHANAGMLVTAMDGDHCKAISEYLFSIGVKDQVTVLFDTPNANETIENFSKSRDRILIAVKMISEGVDITRLRVGVYASNVLTKMFFTQFVGRFIRWDKSLDSGQHALVVIPNHVVLEKYALEIEAMVNSAFMDDATPNAAGDSGDDNDEQPRFQLIDKGGDGDAGKAIERGQMIEETERRELEMAMKAAGICISLDQMRKIRDHFSAGSPSPVENTPVQEEERDISRHNDKLVGRIVVIAKQKGLTGYEHNHVNSAANRAVGIRRKDRLTPESVLEARLVFLKSMLAAIYAGKTDDTTAA